MKLLDPFAALAGFEWDEGNEQGLGARGQGPDGFQGAVGARKVPSDVEAAFGNAPVVVAEDVRHSQDESRLTLLGRTNADRYLFVAFTVREARIRVISVRSMSLRERRRYGDARSAEA